MTRRNWKMAIGLLWAALPFIALRYWQVWDRLPARLATHFDAAGRPNGWMTPQGSLISSLVFTLFLLGVATVVLRRVRMPDAAAWATVGLFYVVIGSFLYFMNATLEHNLSGRPVSTFAFLPAGILTCVIVAIVLFGRRGPELAASGPVTEEVHASALWGFVMLIPAVGMLMAAADIRVAGAQIGLAAGGALLLLIAATAWSGFHYIFSPGGLEIRMLGLRLRSIPAGEIRQYAVGRWNPLYGYGIRGIGNQRGYVWGNRGVRIEVEGGEVFLGHSDPQRIVRDLDRVKQVAK